MKERCDVLARFCNSTHSPLLPTTRHASLRHSRSVAEVYCGCHFKISLSTFGFGGTPRCPGLTSSKQFQFSLSLPLPRSLSRLLPAPAPALISNGFRERQYGDLTAAKSTIQIWLNGPRPPSSLGSGPPKENEGARAQANSRELQSCITALICWLPRRGVARPYTLRSVLKKTLDINAKAATGFMEPRGETT